MIHTSYALLTAQGSRELNEDWGKVAELPGGGLAAAVADGLGGHGGGQIASEAAGEAFLRFLGTAFQTDALQSGNTTFCKDGGLQHGNTTFCKDGALQHGNAAFCKDGALLEEAAFRANKAVLECQDQNCRMMSTLAGLMLRDGQVRWVHVGDSRVYHFYNGDLCCRTLDHSVSQMAVAMGMIDESQLRFHEDRSRLLRALGSDTFEPEVSEPVLLENGFHAFLLCSDGFWEYVIEKEMEAALAGCKMPGEWLSRMEQLLAGRSTEVSDNYTAAAVFAETFP